MLLAIGHKSPLTEQLFFRHVGWSLSNSLVTFHRGLASSGVLNEVILDETVHVLDAAMAEKRGVILTVPHWSGHELVGAVIARRHPMVMLVRQSSTLDQASRKAQWYRSLGVQTILRPIHASTLAEAVAYLKVLKSGRMLAITPDLLTSAQAGVEVAIFNRSTRINAGAFALAVASGAPMIRVSGQWQDNAGVIITFERAPTILVGDRKRNVQTCAQDWCNWFERTLRANPENWLFWLDKRWSRFLRVTPPLGREK